MLDSETYLKYVLKFKKSYKIIAKILCFAQIHLDGIPWMRLIRENPPPDEVGGCFSFIMVPLDYTHVQFLINACLDMQSNMYFECVGLCKIPQRIDVANTFVRYI